MRKSLAALFLTIISFSATAQKSDSLFFLIKIDSCSIGTNLLNADTKEFYLAVKNTSAVLPLFKKDDIELGIKLYVNTITEDGRTFMILKHVFMKKTDEGWDPFSTSEYYPIDKLGYKTLTVRTNNPVPDFRIQYSVTLDDEEGDEKQAEKTGIIDLVPALKPKEKPKKN